MSKPYTLKSPCTDCPFRCDVARTLGPERAQEIMNDTYEDSNFYCHKTIDYSDDDGGRVVSKSRVCAGFLATMENEGRANQPTRIAERLGIYDRTQLEDDAPVYGSMQEWVRSYLPDSSMVDDSLEHCGVVSSDCIDPAGYARGGEVLPNSSPPTCSKVCMECEMPVCSGCVDRVEAVPNGAETITAPVCVYCA